MRILIYGGGSVGLGMASCLIKAGAEVHILAREAAVALLRAQGLRRGGLFGPCHAPPESFSCSSRLDEIAPGMIFDFVLVCVKSFDTGLAARDLARHPSLWEPRTRIVLCQNGWGNREAFLAHLSGLPTYNARVITGFTHPQGNQVEITVHAEAVHVGTLGGEDLSGLETLCAALSAGDLPSRVTPHIERDLWAKMLYNCSLNPLGVIFGVTYGALADSAHTRQIMDATHDEIFAVMAAAGYQTHWKSASAYREIFYGQLVPATASHYSSTLQDIQAGKRTEIDALNGAVVELGREHAVWAPIDAMLCQMVKFQESRHLTHRGSTAGNQT